MKRYFKHLVMLFFCSFAITRVYSQDTLKLTLFESIEMAKEGSYDALIAQNEYMASYWTYQNYKSSFLPTVDLHARPATFNRAISKQFNPIDTSYEYFEERNLNSYLSMNLNQSLPFSGGTIFIDSDLGRLSNFGDRESEQFSATAFRIGLHQPIFGFNQFKWNKKLQPLRYEIDRKVFTRTQEEISLKVIDYFFGCAKAHQGYRIAVNNHANADSLYNLGLKRFELTSITKSELLSLKLEVVNAKNRLKQARNLFERASKRLLSFLGLDETTIISTVVPEEIPSLEIDAHVLLDKARQYNPEYLSFKYQELEAEKLVEQAKIESRFSASLSASYGLNQRSETFTHVYNDMLDQERFDLTLNIPVVDWGVRKNRYKLSERQKDAKLFALRRQENDLEQNILMTVSEFNLQDEMVESAREAAEIAVEVYNLTMQRFMIGEVNVNDLIIRSNSKDSALNNYYDEINEYWRLFYTIREISMYDFILDKPLDAHVRDR